MGGGQPRLLSSDDEDDRTRSGAGQERGRPGGKLWPGGPPDGRHSITMMVASSDRVAF